MKILIAPDSFKGSLTSVEVTEIIKQAFQSVMPNHEYYPIPMGDGGTGTLAAISYSLPIKLHTVTITGPLFEQSKATFGILEQDNTAIIEVAEACGLHLISKDKQNPLKTTSFGAGELIRHALDKGCRRFIVGLGGSATCDGGIGALTALGLEFKDINNENLKPTGENLEKIVRINTSELDPRLSECGFILAHDVDNPLLGSKGALMYAPQKGAPPENLIILEKGLENYAKVVSEFSDTDIDFNNAPGLGSAGGLTAGLQAFLNAKMVLGANLMIDLLDLSQKLDQATLVITGEGQLDHQSLHGKTPIAIAKLAQEKNVPTIALVGAIEGEMKQFYNNGLLAAFNIVPGPVSKEIDFKNTKVFLRQTAINIARLLKFRMEYQ